MKEVTNKDHLYTKQKLHLKVQQSNKNKRLRKKDKYKWDNFIPVKRKSPMEITEHFKLIVTAKICPYCQTRPEYVDSEIIYGKSYGMIYFCKECNAYCGVHKGTNVALGRLANKALRELKKEAHKYFDEIWKSNKMTRNDAYKWLSDTLNIPLEYTHIGMFDENLCKNARTYCYQYLNP